MSSSSSNSSAGSRRRNGAVSSSSSSQPATASAQSGGAASPSATSAKLGMLSVEHAKMQSQLVLFKKAVLKEQHRNAELTQQLQDAERLLADREEELETANFNVNRLEKRVTKLVLELDNMKCESQSRKGGGFLSMFGLGKSKDAEQIEVQKMSQEMAVLQEELELKIQENEQLHISIFEMRTDHDKRVEDLNSSNAALSEKVASQRTSFDQERRELRSSLHNLEAECERLKSEVDALEATLHSFKLSGRSREADAANVQKQCREEIDTLLKHLALDMSALSGPDGMGQGVSSTDLSSAPSTAPASPNTGNGGGGGPSTLTLESHRLQRAREGVDLMRRICEELNVHFECVGSTITSSSQASKTAGDRAQRVLAIYKEMTDAVLHSLHSVDLVALLQNRTAMTPESVEGIIKWIDFHPRGLVLHTYMLPKLPDAEKSALDTCKERIKEAVWGISTSLNQSTFREQGPSLLLGLKEAIDVFASSLSRIPMARADGRVVDSLQRTSTYLSQLQDCLKRVLGFRASPPSSVDGEQMVAGGSMSAHGGGSSTSSSSSTAVPGPQSSGAGGGSAVLPSYREALENLRLLRQCLRPAQQLVHERTRMRRALRDMLQLGEEQSSLSSGEMLRSLQDSFAELQQQATLLSSRNDTLQRAMEEMERRRQSDMKIKQQELYVLKAQLERVCQERDMLSEGVAASNPSSCASAAVGESDKQPGDRAPNGTILDSETAPPIEVLGGSCEGGESKIAGQGRMEDRTTEQDEDPLEFLGGLCRRNTPKTTSSPPEQPELEEPLPVPLDVSASCQLSPQSVIPKAEDPTIASYHMVVGGNAKALPITAEQLERERMLEEFFARKNQRLEEELRVADRKAVDFHIDYQRVQLKYDKCLLEKDELGVQLKQTSALLAEVQDQLDTTKRNYEDQIRALSENLCETHEHANHLDKELSRLRRLSAGLASPSAAASPSTPRRGGSRMENL